MQVDDGDVKFRQGRLYTVNGSSHLDLITRRDEAPRDHIMAGFVGAAAALDLSSDSTVVHVEHRIPSGGPGKAILYRGQVADSPHKLDPPAMAAELAEYDRALAGIGHTLFRPSFYYLGCKSGADNYGFYGRELMEALVTLIPPERFLTEHMIAAVDDAVISRSGGKYSVGGGFISIDRDGAVTQLRASYTEAGSFASAPSAGARVFDSSSQLVPRTKPGPGSGQSI